jgi:hypothetical protein
MGTRVYNVRRRTAPEDGPPRKYKRDILSQVLRLKGVRVEFLPGHPTGTD